jgi:hypothetical protein
VEISPEDLEARQVAMQKAFELAGPYAQANTALRRLREQVASAIGLIREAEGGEGLADQASALSDRLDEIGDRLGDLRRASFAAFGIERSTTRPTDDQVWQLDHARAELPPLIERLNAIISEDLPSLYSAMNEADIRPDPGEPIEVPRWQH